jgi:hypothetical protein
MKSEENKNKKNKMPSEHRCEEGIKKKARIKIVIKEEVKEVIKEEEEAKGEETDKEDVYVGYCKCDMSELVIYIHVD